MNTKYDMIEPYEYEVLEQWEPTEEDLAIMEKRYLNSLKKKVALERRL